MSLRRAVALRMPVVLVALFVSALFMSSDVQGGHVAEYSPSVAGARDFAQDFCPDVSYPEDKIADVMWLSAPGGGNRVDVIEGGNQNVPVKINFFVTYCANWAQGYTNGATDMQSWQGGVNRLSSGPGSITYGPKTTGYGTRSEWGVTAYDGTLNVANLPSGEYKFCTYFRTTTDRPKTVFIVSPNICFPIVVNRIVPWTINGQSYVDNTSDGIGRQQGNPAVTASPGNVLNWFHDLRNNGPGAMNRTVYYNVDRSGFGNGWDASKVPTGNASGGAGVLFVNFGGSPGNNTQYTVQASDGGRTLCQRISWRDAAWDTPGVWGSSGFACARIPFNYNLTPSVTGPSGVGTVGSPIPTVTPRVNNQLTGNAGTTTDSPSVEWQLKRVEVVPGGSIPLSQQENGTLPCAHYGNACIAKGDGTRTFPAGSTSLAALTGEMIAPNTPVGTRVCYTLSVRPYSQANGNWRHSAPVCVKVSKQPKVQVWGHDARTRGGIETGTTIVNSGGTNKLFGSWVEYGGFSVGANNGFATGSGLNTGNTNTTTEAAWHRLTFANINNSGASDFGRFALPANLPTITDQFIGAPSGGAFNSDLGALNSGTYVVGNVAINASAVGQEGAIGKSIIIVSSGTVTINGNIVYEGEGASGVFTTIRQIPQVVIVARAINITGAVTQIDAWLLTTSPAGMINTCSDVPLNASLNSNVCNNVLTVNGPVATQHLHLRRTGGSNTVDTAGDPAEIFNLRPDAYIWAYGRSSQSGKAQTVYSVELPPRF